MERKRHLGSGKCEGVPPDPSVAAKKIVKNDNDVYVCKESNTETRHRNNVSRQKFQIKPQSPIITLHHTT